MVDHTPLRQSGSLLPTYQFPHYRLLVMGKSPELGKVKTRMQPFLTEESSARLQTQLSRYVLAQWQMANLCPIHFWVGGDIDYCRQQVMDTLPSVSPISLSNISLFEQVAGDLGQRMATAVEHTWVKFPTTDNSVLRGVILLGTDCPFIDKPYLEQALTALESLEIRSGRGYDVVIGPANDGGYVLLGMKAIHKALFEDIPWGTSKVLAVTEKILQEHSLVTYVLPPLNDIDTKDDLPLLDDKRFPDSLRRFSSLST